MRHFRLLSLLLLLGAGSAQAIELGCRGPNNVEEFRYSWRLRGGIRFLAGLIFPTSGVGNLKTTFPTEGHNFITSELLITAPQGQKGGFYAYESEMDAAGEKTLMTYAGYAWGEKARQERTNFDYVKRLARIRRETPEKVEHRVKKLPSDELRDILTVIYYLREHASEMTEPVTTSIYTDGKQYPVVFRPLGRREFVIEKRQVNALGFEIVDAPGGKKWPGGVKVWLTDDDRRIPCRIEIQQSVASVQLDLQSVEGCSF